MLLREIVKIHGKKIKTMMTGISGINTNIGDINTNINGIENNIGNLSSLKTTEKSNLVGAVNENTPIEKNPSYPNADSGFVWIKYGDGTFELWYKGTKASTAPLYSLTATCDDFTITNILGGSYSGGLQASPAHGLKYTELGIAEDVPNPKFVGYGDTSGPWIVSGYMFGRWR